MKKTIYSSEHGKVIERLVQARVEANLCQVPVFLRHFSRYCLGAIP